MDLDKALEIRHSAREFQQKKKPSYRKIIQLIEAASKAPLAGNLPALKYILVSNKKQINELANAAQQSFISTAPWIIVVCCDKKLLDKYYYDRAERYARHQAGAATQNILMKVTDLGLASSWVGAFSDSTVKRVLKIPDNVNVDALLPIGYETPSSEKAKRIPKPNIDGILFFDQYKKKKLGRLAEPEIQG